uniref:Histidine acid phosphatase family protein n=1 Tax=Rhabditophanes sp. KR3021 TaxID=114890 RepID=A0AC35UBY3_9BILA
MKREYFLFFIFCIVESSQKELVSVQVLWRHGDRTPTNPAEDYDPNKNYKWTVPLGELTPTGMRQHYELGKRLMKRYTKEYKLISKVYNATDFYCRSTDKNRALASAYCNLAGFFSKSEDYFDKKENEWKFDWVPVPVHSTNLANDYLLNTSWNCTRLKQLEEQRLATPEFIAFQKSNTALFNYFQNHANVTVNSYKTLKKMYGTIRVEKEYYNLEQPSWLTDKIYNDMKSFVEHSINYVFGGPGFNLPEDIELLKLKGGNLLSTMINNMERVIGNKEIQKFISYSSHDTTLMSFANVLQAKDLILGSSLLDYASNFLVELWRDSDNEYYVKVLYGKNAFDTWEVVTDKIGGCDGDYCFFKDFKIRSEKYILPDPLNSCT